MKLKHLQTKAERLGELIGQPLVIGQEGRKYRVERPTPDGRAPAGFSPAYLPGQELWDRMDYAESALNLLILKLTAAGITLTADK